MSQHTESQLLGDYTSSYIPEAARRCKIVISGSQNVGKSTFIERLEFGKFNQEKSLVKMYRVFTRKCFEQTITVELIEKDLAEFTASGENKLSAEMRDVDAIIVLYAVNNLSSFEELKNSLVHVQRKIPPTASITVVGSKADEKELQVNWKEVDQFSEQQNLSCFEASSKNGVNVELILNDILEIIFERRFGTDDDDVMSEQPVYATTVLSSQEDEPQSVSGYCWIPKVSILSLFGRK